MDNVLLRILNILRYAFISYDALFDCLFDEFRTQNNYLTLSRKH